MQTVPLIENVIKKIMPAEIPFAKNESITVI